MINKSAIERSYSLDFLKIICSIIVAFLHYQMIFDVVFTDHINFYFTWFEWWRVVEFFCLLSGYFMYKNITAIQEGKYSLIGWYFLRAKRILPMVMVTTALIEYLVILEIKYTLHLFSVEELLLSLWQSMITALGMNAGWFFGVSEVNNNVWYIGVLMLCYVVFFIVTKLAQVMRSSPLNLYIFMVFLGIGIQFYGINLPFLNSEAARGYYSFFFGLILAYYVREIGISKRSVLLAMLAMLITVLYLLKLQENSILHENRYLLVYVIYPALVILFETDFVKGIFKHPFWGLLGKVSFEVYMWHGFVYVILNFLMKRQLLSFDVHSFKTMYLFVAIVEIVAFFAYFFIEKPLSKLVDREFEKFTQRVKGDAGSLKR